MKTEIVSKTRTIIKKVSNRDSEFRAFENMLDIYPTGIVSIVSDTYDVYRVLTEFAERLKPRILARDGKVVFRPDSGNPETIICGTIQYVDDVEDYINNLRESYHYLCDELKEEMKKVYCKTKKQYYQLSYISSYTESTKDNQRIENFACINYEPTNEEKGAIVLLDEMFGSSINEKGYKQLNPKVGLIYGDGMYIERYEKTLARLKQMGYAASNLVIGVGGILRNHSRDTLGFALKATYVEVNGEQREIEKDPITDNKKKSHKGLVSLYKVVDVNSTTYTTLDQRSWDEERGGELHTVFKDGKLLRETTFEKIKERLNS